MTNHNYPVLAEELSLRMFMNMANHESHRAADGRTHEHVTSCRCWSSPAKSIAVQTRAHMGWTCWPRTGECWRLDSMVLLLRHLLRVSASLGHPHCCHGRGACDLPSSDVCLTRLEAEHLFKNKIRGHSASCSRSAAAQVCSLSSFHTGQGYLNVIPRNTHSNQEASEACRDEERLVC